MVSFEDIEFPYPLFVDVFENDILALEEDVIVTLSLEKMNESSNPINVLR